MHRLLCEDGVLYVYISPAQELIMIRDNELCPSCGGTGFTMCRDCNGKGLCPDCMSRRHKTPRTPVKK